MNLLTLHLEMLGCILCLLNRFAYLHVRTSGDLMRYNHTRGVLRKVLVLDAPCRLTDGAENKFRGLILTVGNKIRKL